MLRSLALVFLVALLVTGCRSPISLETAPVAAVPTRATATLARTFTPSVTSALPLTALPSTTTRSPTTTTLPVPTLTHQAAPLPATVLPTATAPLTATPTLDPFQPFYIETLRARRYGEHGIKVGTLLEEMPAFRRYAFSYLSDGLHITGYLNLPQGTGPFPVVILNHGYYFLDRYRQGDGTRPAADFLAARGFLTLASDYRNYAGSDPGPNPFRFGYVVDVMNLLAELPTLPPEWADTERVGMWGHSMGGGLTINAAVLAGERLDAVVVYGGMSGDMAANTRHIQAMWQRDEFNGPVRDWGGPDAHPDAYARMSALGYLPQARTAFAIHHGTHDEQVPYPWSETLRDAVAAAGLPVEHFAYPGASHNFQGETWSLFMERVVAFFEANLR